MNPVFGRVLIACLCTVTVAACAQRAADAPPVPDLSISSALEAGHPPLAAEFRPGHAATFQNKVDPATAHRAQLQASYPEDRSSASLNRALMETLTGTTLILRGGSSTEALVLSPDGRAGVVAEGRGWKQMGAAEQWYVNAENDLCVRDRYMVHLEKREGGTQRTFHQGGWCLEIAEISDGTISIAWGDRIYYRGKTFQGDILNMAAREEELTRYYTYWDTH